MPDHLPSSRRGLLQGGLLAAGGVAAAAAMPTAPAQAAQAAAAAVTIETLRPVASAPRPPLLPDPYGEPLEGEFRSLERIRDGLYRFQVDEGTVAHTSLILVTDEGILVTDPVRTRSARWLRDELKRRFAVPVKYVVYTHAHFDHIGGGQVFQADGAKVVAHENAVEPIRGEGLPTAVPDLVYSKRADIVLGKETVELHHIAPSHSNSLTVLRYPRQLAIQAVDFCPVGYLPYNDFLDFYYDGWMESLRWLHAQEFEVLEGGHYALGDKASVAIQIDYMQNLHDEVVRLLRAGYSWDQLWRSIQYKPQHRALGGFDAMRVLNARGMYRWCENHRRGVW